MAQPLLPPRGIFIPTHMIFNTQFPPAVLVTWIKLRCLAWKGWITPPLSIPELASLIGIHPTRLHKHLSQLLEISALSCRTTQGGKLILSFTEEHSLANRNPGTSIMPSWLFASQFPGSRITISSIILSPSNNGVYLLSGGAARTI